MGAAPNSLTLLPSSAKSASFFQGTAFFHHPSMDDSGGLSRSWPFSSHPSFSVNVRYAEYLSAPLRYSGSVISQPLFFEPVAGFGRVENISTYLTAPNNASLDPCLGNIPAEHALLPASSHKSLPLLSSGHHFQLSFLLPIRVVTTFTQVLSAHIAFA